MSKKLLVIIVIAGILVIGGYFFLRFTLKRSIDRQEEKTGQILPTTVNLGGKKVSIADLRPLFIKRLQLLLKKSSNGLYEFSLEEMQTDILASRISLVNVKVQPNTEILDSLKKIGNDPDNTFNLSFKYLVIEGINFDDAINSKVMNYDLIKLVSPVIEIHHKKSAPNPEKDKEEFSQRFLKEMEMLSIKNLIVENGIIISYNDNQKRKPVRLSDVSVKMSEIIIDSVTRKDPNRFLFSKKATLSFKNFSVPAVGGLYNLKIGSVSIKAPEQQIILNNLSFTSPFSKEQFVDRQKFSRELYHLVLPSVTINNVNWWLLLNEEELVADQINARKGNLSIYLDRSLPPHSKVGNFPNQLLMKIPIKMSVNKLKISGLDFSYEEYNPISKRSGAIYIDNVELNVTNISNESNKKAKPVVAQGSGLFMHTVPMQANFSFDMSHPKLGKFSSGIKANGFDGPKLNSFAEPLGLMKIENGTLQKTEVNITGDQWKASGNVLVLYKDLKLSLLEKDAGKSEIDRKDFTSTVANLFVLKKDNPKGNNKPRLEKAEYKRIPEGGFFMLIWKTMMVGTLRTIGAPEKIAHKTVREQEEK